MNIVLSDIILDILIERIDYMKSHYVGICAVTLVILYLLLAPLHLIAFCDQECSMDGRFIVTADRDFKIRVRYYDNHRLHQFSRFLVKIVTSISRLASSPKNH